jgi:hypothetical protein
MDRIVCEWCKEQNEPNRADCIKCGAPLDVKNRIKDPESKPVSVSMYVSSPASIQLPKSSSRGLGIVIAVIVVTSVLPLVIAAIAWALSTHSSSPSRTTSSAIARPTTTTTPQPPPNLLTLGGLSGLLAQIRTKFGDTMGYELLVYPDNATLSRPDTANSRKRVGWLYGKDGWIEWSDISEPDTTVGDLSKFDLQAVLGVVHGAAQTLHVTNPTSTYLFVYSKNDGLSLELHVTNDTDGGYMMLTADGTITRTVPAD